MWNYITFQNAIRIIVNPLPKKKKTFPGRKDLEPFGPDDALRKTTRRELSKSNI
jgi:hypothetical protein